MRKAAQLALAGPIMMYAALCYGDQVDTQSSTRPGSRVVMDAHNCYPYSGQWGDRIDRALGSGFPLAIEQDLVWYTDKRTGRSWSVVSHGDHLTGKEPTVREYFFERIRPIMEKALREGNKGDWPLITLNLDFKTDEPEHHAAIWRLLKEYEAWITTAERVEDKSKVTPLSVGPLLVLTGENDRQEVDFHDIVPTGEKLLVFGAAHAHGNDPMAPAEVLAPEPADNYRRWWNNPWQVVERGGQRKAGDWTQQDDTRLRKLVSCAHAHGLWIRFYTLDGLSDSQLHKNGWDKGYNFGSRASALLRWNAAIEAGVDFLASDQYEEVAAVVRKHRTHE